MKKTSIFLILMSFLALTGCSKDDPITRTITLNSTDVVSELTEEKIDGAEILSIRGTMNQEDFTVLKANRTIRHLSLEHVTIVGTITVAEGDTYTGNAIPQAAFGINSDLVGSTANNYISEIVLPVNVQVVGQDAFNGCASLYAAYMSDNVLRIYPSAFENCTALRGNFWMPETVQSIGASAFSGCTGLDGVLILNLDLETIGSGAFTDTRFKQINVQWDVQSDIPALSLTKPYFPSQFKNGANNYIVIPKGTTAIYNAAWDNGEGECYFNIIENKQ